MPDPQVPPHPLTVYRDTHGLKQVALAALLFTTKTTMCRLEAGERQVTIPLLKRLSPATNGEVTPEAVLDWQDKYAERARQASVKARQARQAAAAAAQQPAPPT